MLPGAGDAVSRRRWALLSVMLASSTFVLLFRVFTGFPVCLSLTFGEKRSRWTSRRRRALLFFVVVILATLSPRLASVSAMSREGSLTTALIWFTASLPVEPTSGCRKTSHIVDSVQAVQPTMELNFKPMSSLFPSLGRPEPNIPPCFAPLLAPGTRFTSFTRVDPSFIGNSSFSPPLKVKAYSPAWILSSDCKVHLQRCLSCVISSGTDLQTRSRFRSGASLSISTAKSEMSVHVDWAWPICATKPGSPKLFLPKSRGMDVMIRPLLVSDGWVNLLEISCGFTGISSRCILLYFSSGIMLQVGSPGLVSISPFFSNEKCLLSPFLFSMKGDVFLVSLPSISFRFFTGLSSYVVVCTGSEDATEITSVFLVGESWLSTSLVTISQLSDFVVKTISTQSSFALISLSSSFEELSILTYVARIAYVFRLRGWIIPSIVCCNRTS